MTQREQVREFLRATGGASGAQIAEHLGVARSTLSQVLTQALAMNEIHNNGKKRNCVYYDGPRKSITEGIGRCSSVFDLAKIL